MYIDTWGLFYQVCLLVRVRMWAFRYPLFFFLCSHFVVYIDVWGLLYWVCLLMGVRMWASRNLHFFCIRCIMYFKSETNDLILGALDHCPFHHYIHCWCDFTSCLIWVDHYSFLCYLLRHHPCFVFDSSLLSYHCPSLLTLTYSKFDIALASLLRVSLSVLFTSLSHYWYYIHIGHLQVQGSRAFLYMLHFIHEGMGFSSLGIWA